MKRACIVCLASVAVLTAGAFAATETQKQAAIDAGLAHLAGIQQGGGNWLYGGGGGTPEQTGSTAAALLAFLEEGHTPTSATAYSPNVTAGLTYILNQGNIDGGGLVRFVTGATNARETYVNGLVLPSIVATGTPNAVVAAGPLAGLTYAQVVNGMVKTIQAGQKTVAMAPYTGGWRYYTTYGDADQSTSQWPVLGLLYASTWQANGVTIPAGVEPLLDQWMAYVQMPDGGARYNHTTLAYSNQTRTGILLLQQAYSNWPNEPANAAKVKAALDYLEANWAAGPSATWDGNFGHWYAMWAVYKGLEVTIGLDDGSAADLADLDMDGLALDLTPRPQGAAVIDAGDTWNWWEDYCEYLVQTQSGTGAWPNYSNWPDPLSTAWAVNILQAVEVPPPPPPAVIPEPLTMAGVGLGVVGLIRYLRRRR